MTFTSLRNAKFEFSAKGILHDVYFAIVVSDFTSRHNYYLFICFFIFILITFCTTKESSTNRTFNFVGENDETGDSAETDGNVWD